jgi:1-deoxy-D-xylulose-5-phosphate reductoisomerase
MAVAKKSGAHVLPVDSEHNAIFQALETRNYADVDHIVLTASGGPFHDWPKERMAAAKPNEALAHPNWSMGQKVTIDSATLMNKGLEVIEAHHLFELRPPQIEVLVHRQSVVHGMVAYRDGSVLAQLSNPDMRVPIAHCLFWPRRSVQPHNRLDLAALGSLTFEKPDVDRFPALTLARSALASGGWATNILNAANEVAVNAFLKGRLGFLGIVPVVAETLDRALAAGLPREMGDVADALALDAEGRRLAEEALVSNRKKS